MKIDAPGPTKPNTVYDVIAVKDASTNITAIGLRYFGIFIAVNAITIVGTSIIMSIPTNNGNDVIALFKLMAYVATDPVMPKITRVVAFARPLVDTPPLSIPDDKNTKPTNNVNPDNACIPVRNVLVMPMYDKITPARPIADSPIPGIIRSQSLI